MEPNKDLPYVASIHIPDDGVEGYWRGRHAVKLYHKGQPNRKVNELGEGQNCIAAYPEFGVAGRYGFGDEWCMQKMNTICQVNYGGLL